MRRELITTQRHLELLARDMPLRGAIVAVQMTGAVGAAFQHRIVVAPGAKGIREAPMRSRRHMRERIYRYCTHHTLAARKRRLA
jgi:hypothetical protein